MFDNAVMIKAIVMAMEEMECKLVDVRENKLYFEIPSSFTQEQVGIAKEVINRHGCRLFTKRV